METIGSRDQEDGACRIDLDMRTRISDFKLSWNMRRSFLSHESRRRISTYGVNVSFVICTRSGGRRINTLS